MNSLLLYIAMFSGLNTAGIDTLENKQSVYIIVDEGYKSQLLRAELSRKTWVTEDRSLSDGDRKIEVNLNSKAAYLKSKYNFVFIDKHHTSYSFIEDEYPKYKFMKSTDYEWRYFPIRTFTCSSWPMLTIYKLCMDHSRKESLYQTYLINKRRRKIAYEKEIRMSSIVPLPGDNEEVYFVRYSEVEPVELARFPWYNREYVEKKRQMLFNLNKNMVLYFTKKRSRIHPSFKFEYLIFDSYKLKRISKFIFFIKEDYWSIYAKEYRFYHE